MGDEPGSRRVVGDWEILHKIGSGSFAIVWKAVHRASQVEAAVKEINTANLNRKLQDSLASEITVLEKTRHPNIVGLLDIIKDGNRIFIVLEYCSGGDLGNFIKRYRKVQEATAKQFMHQLAEGLKELRLLNLVHRDLKPQNLLLSSKFTPGGPFPLLKIADFGFARSLHPQTLADTLCGSPLYMAPEILQAQRYGAKADLWSVGVILFELVAGKPPFGGNNHVQLLHNINTTEARLPDAVAACLSDSCRSLLRHLLRRNPVDRLTFEEFFAHPFIQDSGATSTSPEPPPLPPDLPLGEAPTHPDDTPDPSKDGLLSEALEKTISRWASQHAAAAPPASPRPSDPGQSPRAPTDSSAAAAGGASGAGGSTSTRGASYQQQPLPSPRQRSGMARQLSSGSGAAAVVQNLLMGLSPPRLPPLFSFSTPQQPASLQQQPTPPPVQRPPQPAANPQPHPAASGGSDDMFDHDFVIVSSPQPRSKPPTPTPQLLYPRARTPEQPSPLSLSPSPTPGTTSPVPSTTTLQRAPSRSALTTLLAAAAASGSSTPLSGSGTLPSPPSTSPLSASAATTAPTRASTPPLPHSYPATFPIHQPQQPAPTTPTPTPTHSAPNYPLGQVYSTTPTALTAAAPPTIPTTPSATPAAATHPAPQPLPAGTPPTSTIAEQLSITTAAVVASSAAPSAARAGTPSTAGASATAATAAAAAMTTSPSAASQRAARAAVPPPPAARLTTSTNPVLPPARLQRLLSDGIAAVANNVDVTALLPRVVAVLLDRCERLSAQQQPTTSAGPAGGAPPTTTTASARGGGMGGPAAGGAAATGHANPTAGEGDVEVEVLGQRLAAMQLLQAACGDARFRPQSPAAAAALQELACRADEGLACALAAAGRAPLQQALHQRAADVPLGGILAQQGGSGSRGRGGPQGMAQGPQQGAALVGFGALLQCVVGLCRSGGALEQAGGVQRRAALVDYASAMDVLLLLLLDAGSAGGPRGRAGVEQQVLRLYGAVASRWTAAGGGTL